MKQYLLLLIAILMLVASVSGTSLTFQNPTDFSAQVTCTGTGACSWTHHATGGNNYVTATGTMYVISQTALPMTYSAATISGCSAATGVKLFDGALANLYTSPNAAGCGRYEMKIVAGTATIYKNGTLLYTSGALGANPSYVGWGVNNIGVDDVIWGSTESKYIFGVPENGYFLMKDILNPASSGFYRVNATLANGTPTLISSTKMTSTFGKGSGDNETQIGRAHV